MERGFTGYAFCHAFICHDYKFACVHEQVGLCMTVCVRVCVSDSLYSCQSALENVCVLSRTWHLLCAMCTLVYRYLYRQQHNQVVRSTSCLGLS